MARTRQTPTWATKGSRTPRRRPSITTKTRRFFMNGGKVFPIELTNSPPSEKTMEEIHRNYKEGAKRLLERIGYRSPKTKKPKGTKKQQQAGRLEYNTRLRTREKPRKMLALQMALEHRTSLGPQQNAEIAKFLARMKMTSKELRNRIRTLGIKPPPIIGTQRNVPIVVI